VSTLLLACASMLACASTQGWRLDASRTCERDAAPRACVAAQPDHGHVVELGDLELLPGECAAAAPDAKSGLLRVTSRDPKGRERSRWLAMRRGRIGDLAVDGEGRVAIDRRSCSATP
jgi:hypothetical protein